MNGFGPFVGPFVWFKLYWAAWALLLARGREPVLGARPGVRAATPARAGARRGSRARSRERPAWRWR